MVGSREEKIADSLVLLVRVFRIMKDYGERFGVKSPALDPAFGALRLLLGGNLAMSELGKRLQRSRPNMTAIINKLISEGKVRRLADRKDRRVVRIAITEKGRRFMGKRKKALIENVRKNLARLSNEELGTLSRALEDMNRVISRIGSD